MDLADAVLELNGFGELSKGMMTATMQPSTPTLPAMHKPPSSNISNWKRESVGDTHKFTHDAGHGVYHIHQTRHTTAGREAYQADPNNSWKPDSLHAKHSRASSGHYDLGKQVS